MKKLFLRMAVGVGLLLLLAAVGIALFTHTDHFRELVRERLVAEVNDSIRGEVSIGRVEGSVWGNLTFRDTRLRYDGAEIVRIPRLKVNFSLPALVWGRLQIFHLEAVQPLLRLKEEQAGRWNVVEALSSGEPESQKQEPAGFVVFFERVVLRGGDADLTLSGEEPKTYRLKDLDLQARLAVQPAGVTLKARQIAAQFIAEGLPVLRVKGALAYEDKRSRAGLKVDKLSIESEASRLQITGGIEDLDAMHVDAKISMEKLASSDISLFIPAWPIKTDLTGVLDLRGPPGSLEGALSLAAGEARLAGELRADLTGGSPRYRGVFRLGAFSVGELLEKKGVSGELSGLIDVEGKGFFLPDLSGVGDLKFRSAQIGEWGLGDIAVNGRLRESVLRLAGDLKSELGGADWRGTIALKEKPEYELSLSVKNLDIQKVSPDGDAMQGKLNFKGTMQGAGIGLAETNARANLQILPSTIGPVQIQRGALKVRLADQRIRIARLQLAAEDAMVTVEGEIGTSLAQRGTLAYDLRVKRLSPWLSLIGRRGSGSVDLTGRAQGNLSELRSQGTMKFAGLELAEVAIRKGDIAFDLVRSDAAALPHGNLKVRLGDVQAGIRLQKIDGAVSLPEEPADEIRLTATAQDHLDRTHKMEAGIAYGPEEIVARVTQLALDSPAGVWKLSQPATVTKRADDIFIDRLLMGHRDQRLILDGHLSLTGSQSLTLGVESLPLQSIYSFLAFSPERPDLTGILWLKAEVGGTAAAPEITVSAELKDLQIAGQGYEGMVGSGVYRDEKAQLKLTVHQDREHALNATGTMPISLSWSRGWQAEATGNMDFRVHSSGLSLAFVNAMIGDPIEDIAGEISLDMSLSGTISQPLVKGDFRLREGRARLEPLGLRLSSVMAEGAVDSQAVTIRQISAQADGGQLTGSGSIALKDYRPGDFKLSLTAHRWPAIDTSQYQAKLNGDVEVEGALTAPTINGKLEIIEANLRPELDFLEQGTPFKRDETITVVQETAADVSPEKAAESGIQAGNGVWTNTRLDIMIALPGNVWVRHPRANAEASGKVRASKEAEGDLILSGLIEITRGWAAFQGRRFNLTQGRIEFTGGEDINPLLDIVAQHRLREYLVEAVIEGTAEEPSLTLRSEPQLDQADILALLLFGKPVQDLNQSEESYVQQSAIDLTRGYAAAKIGDAVSDALGLEKLGVDLGEFDFTGGRVGFSRYFGRKTYFSISQEVAGEKGREVTVEYQLIPGWKLGSSTTSQGTSSIGIIWRKRY